MQKDLKIGFALGLVLVLAAIIWLATRPSLSPIARMSHTPKSAPGRESFVSPNDTVTNETNTNGISLAKDIPPSNREQIRAEQNQPDVSETPADSARFEQTEKIKTQRFHIVLKKETLSSISQKYYGSAGNWKKIYDYNRNKIKDPNRLIPGTKLIIPN